MPRDAAGVYTLPGAYNPVISGAVIQSAWANTTLADVAQGVTDSLDRSGRGAMLVPLKAFPGTVLLPGITFSAESTTGFSRPSAGRLSASVLGVEIGAFTASGFSVSALSIAGSPFVPGAYLPLVGGTLTGALISSDSGAAIILNDTSGVSIDFSGAGSSVNQINSVSSAALELVTRNATGFLRFYTANAVLALTLAANQNATFAADVSIGDDLAVVDDATIGGDLAVTGNVSAANVLSGTYTPTSSNLSNLTSVTFNVAQYTRVGDTVTISGTFSAVPLAYGVQSFEFTLPIASNLAAATQCAGVGKEVSNWTGFLNLHTNVAGGIYGEITNNTAAMVWIKSADDYLFSIWSYTLTYKII